MIAVTITVGTKSEMEDWHFKSDFLLEIHCQKFYIHLGIQAHICIVLWPSLHVSEGRNDYKDGNNIELC